MAVNEYPSPFDAVAFSFFRAPVSNVRPCGEMTLEDAYGYITSPRAKEATEKLRGLDDPAGRRAFKSANFDYITPSGIFTLRRSDRLVRHSSLLCVDFDHVGDVEGLFGRLLENEYFETRLLFRSPSGEGLKWIIPIDLTKARHREYFEGVAAYCKKTYGIAPDRQCSDVARACFLPHDPDAYLGGGRRSSR